MVTRFRWTTERAVITSSNQTHIHQKHIHQKQRHQKQRHQKQRAQSSQQNLGELAGNFELYGLCTNCKRMPQLNIAQLIEVFGAHTTVDAIRRRLVCNRCGRRTNNIRVVYRGQAGGAAAFRYRTAGLDQGLDQGPDLDPEETDSTVE